MKKFIIGFVLGALLFGIIPAGAAVNYILQKSAAKLTVDGELVDNPELPMLNYKGANYIPAATFRNICQKIKVGFEWVGSKNEIQITTKPAVVSTPTQTPELITQTPDGLKVEYLNGNTYDKVNGKPYISAGEVNRKYYNAKGYMLGPKKGNIYQLVTINKETGEMTATLEGISTVLMDSTNWVTYDYYVSTIMPVVTK